MTFRTPSLRARRAATDVSARPGAVRTADAAGLPECLEPRTLLTTYLVDSAADVADGSDAVADGALTLREAVIAAATDAAYGDAAAGAASDAITFADGLGAIVLAGDLRGDGLTQEGNLSVTDDGDQVIDGAGAFAGFSFRDGAYELSGLTLRNFRAAPEDGEDVSFDADGGAVRTASADLTVTAVSFLDNAAAGSGGAIAVDGGTLTVADSRFDGNDAGEGAAGGAIAVTFGDGAAVTNTVFNANTARDAGGAIGLTGGALTVTGGRFTRNAALGGPAIDGVPQFGDGGAIAAPGVGADLTIDGAYFALNTAEGSGGAIYNDDGDGSAITGATFSSNTAAASPGDPERPGGRSGAAAGGGAVYFASDLTVADTVFFRNATGGDESTRRRGIGGGLLQDGGVLTADDSTFRGNEAAGAGGGIAVTFFDATLTGVRLIGNAAGGGADQSGFGGAIVSQSFGEVTGVVVLDSQIVRNTADRSGGGIYNDGVLTVANTSVAFNTARGDDAGDGGGGIYNRETLTLTDVFVNENRASGENGGGGGLYSRSGTVVGDRVNFAGNAAARAGGGIEAGEGDLRFTDSFLRGNSTDGLPGNGGGYHATGAAFAVFTGGGAFRNVAARGGAFWTNAGGRLVLRDVAARGNLAEEGGAAVWVNGGRLDVEDGSRLIDNGTIPVVGRDGDGATFEGFGGAVWNGGEAFFDGGSRVRGNRAGTGGGLFAAEGGAATIRDAVFAGNAPTDFAGPGEVRGR